MRLPARRPRETGREPRPVAVRGKDERRNESDGRSAARVGRGVVSGGRVGATFFGRGPDSHARPLRRLCSDTRRCRGHRETPSANAGHRIVRSTPVGRRARKRPSRGPRVRHRGSGFRSRRRPPGAHRPGGRARIDRGRAPQDRVLGVARSAVPRWPLGTRDGRTRGRSRRPWPDGREVPPPRARRDRIGLPRCRGADALRLRSRSDEDRGAGRHRRAVVGRPTGIACAPSVDRGRLELLQPPRAEARRRTGDPRSHPAAGSLPKGASSDRRGAGELMAKLYTRRGDAGETGLLGPERVSKDDPRLEAMGTVDELNAVIGLAISAQRERRIRDLLAKIQDDLFTVGAELAMTRSSAGTKVPQITSVHVARLEEAIEAFDVGKITEFILPRGSESLTRLHWARTVARRAERRVVSLSKRETLNPELLRYMNRLSSLLYQVAVWRQKRERRKAEHPSYRE